MSGTFRSAAPDELDGLALARLVSRLGVESRTPCTFAWVEGDDLPTAWERWLETWFAPLLAPAFVETHQLSGTMRIEEVAELDRKLDLALDGLLRTRSLAVGRAFLEGKSEMRANREWNRFAQLVAAGETPGHAPVLFALQTALYHLPLASALAAYAWFELESGLPRTGYRDRPGSGEEALSLFSTALPHVRVAMAADRGDFANDDTPRLRAI